jgi:phosphate starvation-inducible PhoH-like protein
MPEINKLEHNWIIKKIDSETVNIQVTNNDILITIVGQFDQNLKYLAKLTDTNVFFRGNSITCKGQTENTSIFCEAIKFLINKYLLTNIIEKEDIIHSVKKKKKLKNLTLNRFNN